MARGGRGGGVPPSPTLRQHPLHRSSMGSISPPSTLYLNPDTSPEYRYTLFSVEGMRCLPPTRTAKPASILQ